MATIGTDTQLAKKLLEANEVVAVPTETVYGLAGNAYEAVAVQKIFSVKRRPSFDPLIVHAGSLEQVKSLVTQLPEKALSLVESFWPGPLTLVLKKTSLIPELVTSGLPYVAVRIPQHSKTLELLRQLSFPLAAPSANPFGYISPTTPQHVQEQLGQKIPYILDGGACKVGIESTIIGFESAKPEVYRLGGVSLEEIERTIGRVRVAPKIHSCPRSSGMLESHYAPKKPLIVGSSLHKLSKQYADRSPGVLAFSSRCLDIAHDRQVVLTSTKSLEEAAQNFFASLRTLDAMSVVKVILATPVPSKGIGKSVNERLKKASTRWEV